MSNKQEQSPELDQNARSLIGFLLKAGGDFTVADIHAQIAEDFSAPTRAEKALAGIALQEAKGFLSGFLGNPKEPILIKGDCEYTASLNPNLAKQAAPILAKLYPVDRAEQARLQPDTKTSPQTTFSQAGPGRSGVQTPKKIDAANRCDTGRDQKPKKQPVTNQQVEGVIVDRGKAITKNELEELIMDIYKLNRKQALSALVTYRKWLSLHNYDGKVIHKAYKNKRLFVPTGMTAFDSSPGEVIAENALQQAKTYVLSGDLNLKGIDQSVAAQLCEDFFTSRQLLQMCLEGDRLKRFRETCNLAGGEHVSRLADEVIKFSAIRESPSIEDSSSGSEDVLTDLGVGRGNVDVIARLVKEITPRDNTDSDDPAWNNFANCLGVDSDLFFPERGASTKEAKEVCRGCVVREDCLEYALQNGEKFGIWGGMSERERRRIRRQRALARAARRAENNS